MREPDFAGLRTSAMTAARQPDFVEVELRAGRVRRRRRAMSAGFAAVAVILVAAGTGYALRGGATAAPNPAATPIPSARPGFEPAGPPRRVNDVYAGDATHLYAATISCDAFWECPWDLYASDDAGLTWQGRTLPAEAVAASQGRTLRTDTVVPNVIPRVLGPRTVVVDIIRSVDFDRYLSVDGGATWRRLDESAKPAEAVPPGHKPYGCFPSSPGEPCIVRVVDPVAARLAPLANQPPIDALALWDTPPDAGLWVTGWDPDSNQPAVAWSHDAGRTWTSHVIAEDRNVGRMGLHVHTADGRTVYAITQDDQDVALIYRTVDGGANWSLYRQAERLPTFLGFVAGDGTHLLMIYSPREYRASRDGGPYVLERMTGLRGFAMNPVPMAGGGYVTTVDEDRTAIYLSPDGLNWRRVPVE